MYKVVVVVRSLFHQKVDWSGEKNSFLHMINYRVARDFIWKRILENFWIMDLKNTKLCFRNRLNSPALYRHHVSLKNFFVFHSNSMKVSEVLLHIDNYIFTNFHWIQMKNKKTKKKFNDTFNGWSVH